jgi:hypothetical protein
MYGIDEELIIQSVKKYILIGNERIHSKKPILSYTHKKLSFNWLYSRSLHTECNKIYIWENSLS